MTCRMFSYFRLVVRIVTLDLKNNCNILQTIASYFTLIYFVCPILTEVLVIYNQYFLVIIIGIEVGLFSAEIGGNVKNKLYYSDVQT